MFDLCICGALSCAVCGHNGMAREVEDSVSEPVGLQRRIVNVGAPEQLTRVSECRKRSIR